MSGRLHAGQIDARNTTLAANHIKLVSIRIGLRQCVRVPAKCRPVDRDGTRFTYQFLSVLAVLFGVMTARLDMMMFGVAGVAVSAVGVVRGLLVIA